MALPNRTNGLPAEIYTDGATLYIAPGNKACDDALKTFFTDHGDHTTVAITQDTEGFHGGYAQTSGMYAVLEFATS